MTLLFFREIPVGVYINSTGRKSQEKIALFHAVTKVAAFFIFNQNQKGR